MVWGQAQEGREQRPQFVISKPLRQKPESDQRAEQAMHARVGEAQSRHALTGHLARLVDLLERVFAQEAIVAERLDVQETSLA